MGMYANYQLLNDKDLTELKNLDKDEIFETVEDMDETEELAVNIDKMWDVMHFVLTGVDSSEPIRNNPLSEAIVGVNSIEDISEYIAYIEKERVNEIVLALENFDFEKAMENFSMEKCKKANLYPDIWDYEEELEEIKEELTEHFENMKNFYKEILEKQGNILVAIY
ncbi:YfbM family protein [Haemophilus haemoglobinophilus]|nr:YfbM family protein [Canicola haemoglobinophilus]MBN6711860.1 YfbM family protein [Canicola haemoglobinophilus]